MSDEILIKIEDLHINFYMKSGVVRAIDGVSFDIKKGETLGIVGESGCGKSVTANSIMGLISIPPGKIEKGKIIYTVPKELAERIESLYIRKSKRSANATDPKFKEATVPVSTEGIPIKTGLIRRKRSILPITGSGDFRQIDMLRLGDKGLRKIRGKSISMIFQEPMTALNPVIRVGDQISEIVLLHERKELAEAIIRNHEDRIKNISTYKKVKASRNKKGEWACSRCKAVTPDKVDTCPNCGGSFRSIPFRGLSSVNSKRIIRTYKKLAKDPNDRLLAFRSRIPILKWWEKPLKHEALARAERMLRLVRIPDPSTIVNNFPHELSGGMQQRVMIAMALACKPQLLIADEPTTALDVTIQAQILKLMKDLQEELGTSILLITHNLGVVAETCDRIGVMYAGTMAEIGLNRDIFKEPLHPYTQGLMNSIPKVTMDLARLETIEGNVPNLIKPPTGCRFHPRCPYAMGICSIEKPLISEIRPGHFVACHLYTKEEKQ
ncbi:MAG: oligopeptide/dipeptide ABC transporter ATP-binding protein [Methanomassiliicoccales archaeon]|jgi:peptide/nickel transport system ATP-binding protein